MSIITLMTDFGLEDPYVGVMHGVIYSINPTATIVDLSHSVRPQQVRQATFLLSNAYRYFPASTIHLAVIDPGVGTERKAIGLRINEVGTLVGPDNGLFSEIWKGEQAKGARVAAYELSDPAYRLNTVSATFHGRDIFAPAAAHLAAGVPLEAFGPPIPLTDLVSLDITEPKWELKKNGSRRILKGQVVHIDHFGNIITDLPGYLFAELSSNQKLNLTVQVGSVATVRGLKRTYNEKSALATKLWMGDFINLIGSTDYLEVAKVNGNAAQILNIKIGDKIRVSVADK